MLILVLSLVLSASYHAVTQVSTQKLTVWCVKEVRAADDPRVVDEDVHSADLGFHSVSDSIHVLSVREVAIIDMALSATLLHFTVKRGLDCYFKQIP